jgi:tRNA threonylcarbamoyladenosine biosynthesis protein TsaE
MIPGVRSDMELFSRGPEETFRIGRILAEGLKGGDVVSLTGELGSGKTCLTQGIAEGLGVPKSCAVTSPTFTLVNEYQGRQTILYHLDLYRLQGYGDLADMGYDDYLSGGGVMVIEWGEKVFEFIPADAFFVVMTYLEENIRRIELSGSRDRIGFWKKALKKGGY